MLVCVYGDSLSLPRPGEDIAPEETYAELFAAELRRGSHPVTVSLYNRAQGSASMGELVELWNRDTSYFAPRTDVLVIQSGLVDCAPRPLGRWMRGFVERTPKRVRYRIIRLLHEQRSRILRARLGSRITSPRSFRAELRQWLLRASPRCGMIYVLNIAPTTDAVERRSPGLIASISEYNKILREEVTRHAGNVRLIDVHQALRAAVLKGEVPVISPLDGQHITKAGHAIYARLLLDAERARAV